MIKQINQVRQFQETFGQPVSDVPTFPRNERIFLRKALIEEEVRELSVASVKNDRVETLDAIVDCMYVLIGTALEYGLADKLEAAFDEVHASNMSKLEGGKPLFREDGKIMKGKNYYKPNLNQFFDETTSK